MSADQINQLFWLNYAQATKNQANPNIGASAALFIGSKAQEGPVTGPGVPEEYTNQALYNVENNLLASDNLFYSPSAQNGFAQALQLTVDLLRMQASSQPIPKPTTYIVPAYATNSLGTVIQEPQTTPGGTYEPKSSAQFSIDTTVDTASFNFGQTVGYAGANVGNGWLCFSASDGGPASITIFETGSDASAVSIKLLFDSIKAVPISPGSWNVDTSQLKLRDDAPQNLKSLARPSQMLVASRLGYEITFNSNLAGSFDKLYKQTVSASLSIFGLSMSLGPKVSQNTHQISWNLPFQTLKVQPTDNLQTETVVGIVGEKLNA